MTKFITLKQVKQAIKNGKKTIKEMFDVIK